MLSFVMGCFWPVEKVKGNVSMMRKACLEYARL
jgi:hypothetical protein